jgi:hypothetical protein
MRSIKQPYRPGESAVTAERGRRVTAAGRRMGRGFWRGRDMRLVIRARRRVEAGLKCRTAWFQQRPVHKAKGTTPRPRAGPRPHSTRAIPIASLVFDFVPPAHCQRPPHCTRAWPLGLFGPTCAPWAPSQPRNQVAKQGPQEVAVPKLVRAFAFAFAGRAHRGEPPAAMGLCARGLSAGNQSRE